jgi:ADP-ribose pyrophosphatase YjhB (NUDIX family)
MTNPTSTTPHLWEPSHPYYCTQGNYFVRRDRWSEVHTSYDSWADFYADWGTLDPDMNLVFRWDWHRDDPANLDDDEEPGPDKLLVFWVLQRKAILRSTECIVTEADEPAVRAWLETQARTMRAIWEPLLPAPTDDSTSAEAIRYTADIVVTTADGQLLLIERGWDPFAGSWALPGGHVDPGETSLAAAARELAEETGIHLDPAALRQVGVYDAPRRDPRGRYVTVAYCAEVAQPITPTAGDDASAARWHRLDALPPLAFDHAAIVADTVRLRTTHGRT